MSYHFSTVLKNIAFEEVISKVTNLLVAEGFGVLTDIDVKATMKKRLDVDFKQYRILGACHPQTAYKAITLEDKIGVFLPCSIVVQQHEDSSVEVSAVDPIASMMAVNNPELADVAMFIQSKMKIFIEKLSAN